MNKNHIIKLKTKFKIKSLFEHFVFLATIIFLLPNDYINLIPNLSYILYGSVFTLFVYILIFHTNPFFKSIKRNFIIIMPFIISCLSSIINKNDVYLSLYHLFYMVLILMVVYYFFDKNKINQSLIYLEKVMFLLLCLNLFVAFINNGPLLYSESGGRIYLIFEGNIGKMILNDLVLIFILYHKINYRYFLRFIIYLLIIMNIHVSSTTCFSIIFFLFLVLINHLSGLKDILTQYKLILFIIILLDVLIISGIGTNMLAFLFDKSNTLSGRSIIWENILKIISYNLLIGIGANASLTSIVGNFAIGATHAHNQLLQILLTSGITGLFCYGCFLNRLTNIKYSVKNKKMYTIYMKYLMAIFIFNITGNGFDNFFYLISIIMLESNRFVENKKVFQ